MEACISNSAKPAPSSVLGRIRAVDAAVAECETHLLMMVLILCFSYSFCAVYYLERMDTLLGPLLAEQPWGVLLKTLLIALPWAPVSLGFIVLGCWLLCRPFVNLLLAPLWVSADVFLLVTLPFFIADLHGEPFRQWPAWQQLLLPIVCLMLQGLLLWALVNLGKALKESVAAQAS